MEHGELLLTIAEVAVAFAGFASVVGMLGRRSSASHPILNALRMRIMLAHSLVVVVFSFIPFLLHSYGISEEAVWRASSGLFVLATTLVVTLLRGKYAAVRAEGVPAEPWIRFVAMPVFLIELVLSLANVFGFTGEAASAVYLTVLGSRLFLAGIAFSLVISSLIAPSESEG